MREGEKGKELTGDAPIKENKCRLCRNADESRTQANMMNTLDSFMVIPQ